MSDWQAPWAGSMPTNSDVPTMRSTTLPMADMMGEYRSTSKDLRDRLMSQRSSPLLAVASKRRGMLIGCMVAFAEVLVELECTAKRMENENEL